MKYRDPALKMLEHECHLALADREWDNIHYSEWFVAVDHCKAIPESIAPFSNFHLIFYYNCLKEISKVELPQEIAYPLR